LLLIAFVGGCGSMVHDVRFSPTPSFESPDAGTRVLVEVLDESSRENGVLLGPPYRPADIGPEHRYVLVGEESFGARLSRDLVAVLRARGYRAYQRSDSSLIPSETLTLTIKVPTHSIQMRTGQSDVFFDGTFVSECAATVGGASSATWSETIDYTVHKAHFGSILTRQGLMRAFENVYWSAVVEIVHRFSTALPP
jgi:hypothetical protein